ncbi:TPA: fimbrial protein [Escherichia coli]|nr:fimbrial protein [Escherichia coli]EHR8918932.1 fimbrial protein [Escherichia coli]HBV0164378.1 fimbrial protein [Escherichia coli]
MMRITLHKLAILTGLFLSSSVLATDINVDFTATVKASTCNITLTGNNVTSDGNDTYTLTFPGTIGLDKIANKTTQAQANFNLVASGCTIGVSKITTKLSGSASGSSPALIIPSTSDTTSTTDYIGMGIKRIDTDDSTFLTPNSAQSIIWSGTEISSAEGLKLTVALRETSAGRGVPGDFRAQATFNFIYE